MAQNPGEKQDPLTQSPERPILLKLIFSVILPSDGLDGHIFSEAPEHELSTGLLPVRPLEAKLCQFKISGGSPFTKMTKSWDVSPSQWKKKKVVCYPPK